MRAHPAWAFFLLAFVVYNSNCRPISTGDTAPAALLPILMAVHGTWTLDRYAATLSDLYLGDPSFMHKKDGHYYSNYPILLPLLVTPGYLPLRLVPGVREWSAIEVILLARILEKIWAAAIAAAAVAAFFLLASKVAERRVAVVLTLLLAFGTSTWATASQAFWPHGLCELIVILSLLFSLKFLESGRWRDGLLSATLAALGAAARPTTVLFFAVSGAVLLLLSRNRPKVLISYGSWGILSLGVLASYNLLVSNSLLGGYNFFLFSSFNFRYFSEMTVGYTSGLLVYTPFLWFALPALVLCFREKDGNFRPIVIVGLAFFAALLCLYSNYDGWYGGDCFGPRFMTVAMPGAVLLLAPLIPRARRSKPALGVFALVCALSVGVQVIGAFCYPMGEPKGKWRPSWNRNSITLNASAGVYLKATWPFGI